MRTDRLVAVLLLLQQREQVTAAEVARELEVSERTARHDLDALAAASSLVMDPQRWGSSRVEHRPPRFLDELQDAVIRGVQVRLDYVDSKGTETERTVHPLGIVAKGPSWYLVSNTEAGQRTFRIQAVCAPHGIGKLRMVLGDRLEVGGSTTDGRIEVVIRGHNEYALAGELAGLIEWLEVTGPAGVRDHLASTGNALVERYG